MDSEQVPLSFSVETIDWPKSLSATTRTIHEAATKAALAAGAACLHDQADCLERLAGCTTPFEVLTCQLDLAQKMSSHCLSEVSRMFDVLRPNGGPATSIE